MQPDFEPVIERKFHNYINCIEGVYHTGQRDMQRIRINRLICQSIKTLITFVKDRDCNFMTDSCTFCRICIDNNFAFVNNYINCIEGVYHTGQRDMQRIRISIDAFNAGKGSFICFELLQKACGTQKVR